VYFVFHKKIPFGDQSLNEKEERMREYNKMNYCKESSVLDRNLNKKYQILIISRSWSSEYLVSFKKERKKIFYISSSLILEEKHYEMTTATTAMEAIKEIFSRI